MITDKCIEIFDKESKDFNIFFDYWLGNLIINKTKIDSSKVSLIQDIDFIEFHKERTIDYGTHRWTYSMLSEHKRKFYV
jgi:hypothetical protein